MAELGSGRVRYADGDDDAYAWNVESGDIPDRRDDVDRGGLWTQRTFVRCNINRVRSRAALEPR